MEIICSTIKLAPVNFVKSNTSHTFITFDDSKLVTIRGLSRANINRTVEEVEGIKQETITADLELNRPSLTSSLRRSGYSLWVCQLLTADGDSTIIGSKEYPALVSFNGSDVDDTISLTAVQPADSYAIATLASIGVVFDKDEYYTKKEVDNLLNNQMSILVNAINSVQSQLNRHIVDFNTLSKNVTGLDLRLDAHIKQCTGSSYLFKTADRQDIDELFDKTSTTTNLQD